CCRKIFASHNNGGRMGGETDRFEVAFGIVLEVRCQHGRGDMRSHAPCKQGVAVRLRRSYSRTAQCATSATYILNDHLVAKRPAHMFRYYTSHNITWATRWEWNNHCNGFRGVRLPISIDCGPI